MRSAMQWQISHHHVVLYRLSRSSNNSNAVELEIGFKTVIAVARERPLSGLTAFIRDDRSFRRGVSVLVACLKVDRQGPARSLCSLWVRCTCGLWPPSQHNCLSGFIIVLIILSEITVSPRNMVHMVGLVCSTGRLETIIAHQRL